MVLFRFKSAEKSTDYNIQKNIEENTANAGSFEPVKLTVSHILGPLLFLLFGNAFGFLIFLIELIWGNDRRFLRTIKRNTFGGLRILNIF